MEAAKINTTQNINNNAIAHEDAVAFNDFKNSLLAVSLLTNLFIFTAWLTLQVTDRYNAAVIEFLFS